MKRLHFIFILLVAAMPKISAQNLNAIKIYNVSAINSATLDFSPTFYKNGIVFISCNTIEGKNKAFDKRIHKKTMSIFLSEKNENGELKKPEPFSLDLVSALHEGPLSFDKKNEVVFFCRNDSKKGAERGTERAHYVGGFSHMKIYASERTTGSWTQAQELSINEEKTDACHPTISVDGTRLYFASNRPGGYGGMDLYMSEKVYGKWSKPINLGPKVNTPKNEVFPFIHESGALFYSSDDSGGKTGLDIYYTQLDNNGVYEVPQKMDAPFNSESDDFGFILDEDYKSGYMTSNRVGGKGEDDIYAFTATDKLPFLRKKEDKNDISTQNIENKNNSLINIFAIDRKTGTPLSNISILAIPLGQNQENNVKTYTTNTQGKIAFPIPVVNNYTLKINNSDYKSTELSLTKDETKSEIIVLLDHVADIQESKMTTAAAEKVSPPPYNEPSISKVEDKKKGAKKAEKKTKTTPVNKATTVTQDNTSKTSNDAEFMDYAEMTLNKTAIPQAQANKDSNVYHLSNIYYDFNDFKITPQAALTLDTLATMLKENPKMVIELSSYTDSRGTLPFNNSLSKQRAESVLNYLKAKDVKNKQLKSTSLGEANIKNECTDGVPCPPEKHQTNRRTEIRILKGGLNTNTHKE